MKTLTKKEQEAIKKARNRYLKEWRQKNKERQKEAQKAYMERFWLRKAVKYGFI